MTVELYSSPGTSTWTSAKFAATVNASSAYVYGYARTTRMETLAWDAGDTPEQSWFTYGADVTTTVVVSLVDTTPITSAIVYPKDAGVTQEIAGGVLTLTVPTDVRLRVEVNGDRAEALHIFSSPLKATVPAGTTNWTTLGKTVTVDTGTDRLVFGSAHGYTAGQKITITSTGTNPGDVGGAFSPHEQFFITEVDGLEISIGRNEGDSIDLTTAGSGTIKVWPAFYSSTSSALYFGAGEHSIARLFDLANDVTVYIDGGAVVTGSFDLRGLDGVEIKGPGVLSGTFGEYEDVEGSSFSTRLGYCMFLGYNGSKFEYDNSVQGITIVASPYYVNQEGVWSWRNVHSISPWAWEADGFYLSGQSAPGRLAEVYRCFLFQGDDSLKIADDYQNTTVTETFVVNSANSCFHGYYWPANTDNGYTVNVLDCHAMHLGIADSDADGVGFPVKGGNAIIKSWIDGWASDTLKGHFNTTFTGLRVWGPMASRLLSLGNRRYPYNDDNDREQYGQLSNWTISDLVTEYEPGQISLILGKDASNAPSGITFSSIVLGASTVYRSNYTTYFEVSQYATAIVWDDEPVVPDPDTDFVVEDGSGLSTANSYCTVAFADDYHAKFGSPAAWTALTTPQKEAYLRQASQALDLRYGLRWGGVKANEDQAMDWPRDWAYDADGRAIGSTTMPTRLKQAAAYAALLVVQEYDLMPGVVEGADISSESKSVGGLSKSVSYVGGGKPATPQFSKLDRMLATAGLIDGGGSGWGGSYA